MKLAIVVNGVSAPKEFVQYFSQVAELLRMDYTIDNKKQPSKVTLYNPSALQVTEAKAAIALYAQDWSPT